VPAALHTAPDEKGTSQMHSSMARVPIRNPERYIKQVCSHLSRRLRTEFAGDSGVIWRDGDRCVMETEPRTLVLTASAVTSERLAALQDVIARHLERFATVQQVQVRWEPATVLMEGRPPGVSPPEN
jgi:hypothetical protein